VFELREQKVGESVHLHQCRPGKHLDWSPGFPKMALEAHWFIFALSYATEGPCYDIHYTK
jgi:hypothetical protein